MDLCLRATDRKARLEIAVAVTSDVVQSAQVAHELGTTSAIALGRLLTGVALVALTRKQPGHTSAQIMSRGRIRQVYADCTAEGHLRGRVLAPNIAFPLTDGERPRGRRLLSLAIMPGELSLIHALPGGEHRQSSVALASGEVDLDLQDFLERSDQIPTVLSTEALVGEKGKLALGGGVLAQTMPDGDRDALEAIRKKVASGALVEILERSGGDARALLSAIAEGAEIVDAPVPLLFKCRCSRARVLDSLKMLGPADLAEMIDQAKVVSVDCDLCGQRYPVEIAEIRRVFEALITAEG